MTIWEKKSKIYRVNQFSEDFSLFIKQCYRLVWNAEKIHKVKIQKLSRQKTEEWCFYQNMKCAAVKNKNLSKSKKLADY